MGISNSPVKDSGIDHKMLKEGQITLNRKLRIQWQVKKDYQTWLKNMQQMKSIQKIQGGCLYLPQVQQVYQEGICGNTRFINLFFQLYPYTLYNQISNRQSGISSSYRQVFTQQQIWAILYQLVLSSRLFQINKKKSGDIRPRNILINDSGSMAIINILSFPNEETNYLKSLKYHQITYLAPEQLDSLQNQKSIPHNQPLTESFSIGLTILDTALLFNSQILYDYQTPSFKIQIFNENLLRWKASKFSPFLIRTILNMLSVKSTERPSPGQVYGILYPYQKQILTLKPFLPNKQKSNQSLERFQRGKKVYPY